MWVLASPGFWCSWQMVSLENLTGTSPSLYFGVCLWLPSLRRRGGSSVGHVFNLLRTQKSERSSATCPALCQLQQNPCKTFLSLTWATSSTQRKTGIICQCPEEAGEPLDMWATRLLCSLDFSHPAKLLHEGEMVLWPLLIHTGHEMFSPGSEVTVTLLMSLELL